VFLDSLLVPGVKPEEFVTLTESQRILAQETKRKDAIEEPDYDLVVLKRRDTMSKVMVRERLVHISRVDMLPFEQDIYNDKGEIVTQATYDKYQTFNGQPFPTLITIKRPMDEYSLKIEVTKLVLNDKFDSDQFELTIPAGVVVTKMQ
jgi:hypothetical protein